MIARIDMPVTAIRKRLEQLDLGPNAVSMHADYIFDDAILARIKETIPVVREFGTNILIINGAKKRTGDAAEWQLMVDRTRELVEVAEAHDVVLALEFEPDFVVGSTADLLRLFEEVPSPNLAANLDLGHVFLCDPDPLVAIAQVGHENRPLPHRGYARGQTRPSPARRRRYGPRRHTSTPLRATGFDGAMALDLYAYDYEAIAKDTVAYLHQLIDQAH